MSLKPAKDSVDIGIFVSDIKKSLAFYQGILGLEKIEEMQTGFGTLNRLRYGTTDIKLMDPKKVPPAGTIGLEKQLGFRYITCYGQRSGRQYHRVRRARVKPVGAHGRAP